MNHIEEILANCGGIHTESTVKTTYNGKHTYYKFFLVGDLTIPDDIYLQITATATNGTIGKLVDIDIRTIANNKTNQIAIWDVTFILQIDGRKQNARISAIYTEMLKHHDGSTKYVRNIKKHIKEPLKKPITKYKQELNIGDWVFGANKKTLHIGRITRYSKTSVWISLSDDLKDKSAEIRIENHNQLFKIDNPDEIKQHLTFAKLKGWIGD